jgi:hypothetical protein
VNSSHQFASLDSVSQRIEAWTGNVLELDLTPTTVSLFQESDLTRAEGAFSVVENSNLKRPLLGAHKPSPIRSE